MTCVLLIDFMMHDAIVDSLNVSEKAVDDLKGLMKNDSDESASKPRKEEERLHGIELRIEGNLLRHVPA